jgi:hypothetical protein
MVVPLAFHQGWFCCFLDMLFPDVSILDSFYFLSFQGVLRAFVVIFLRHTDDFSTDNINIAQVIRQGAKLSTLLYKRYNNAILNSLNISTLGATFKEKCENSRTDIVRRSYNVFPSPILWSPVLKKTRQVI